MIEHLRIRTSSQGLYEFTGDVKKALQKSNIKEGLCTLFVQHTSASLLIQENADPAVKYDLENWLSRLVPENDRLYTHTEEGPDDMPSHIKSALTSTSISIPVENGKLVLGTWQGIYLFEHRHHGSERKVVVHIA